MNGRSKKELRQRVAIGSNPERNRAHNRRVVLEVIRMHEHLGRTEIARRAQLTAQAVANIVDELLEEGLLVELGRLRSHDVEGTERRGSGQAGERTVKLASIQAWCHASTPPVSIGEGLRRHKARERKEATPRG